MNSKKLSFNPNHFALFLTVLCVEIFIGAQLKTGFIRYSVGDYLCVIGIYYFLRSFLNFDYKDIAIGTLLFAYTIEILQATSFLEWMGWEQSRTANILLGNCFSWGDMIAYSLGIMTVFGVEVRVKNYDRKYS